MMSSKNLYDLQYHFPVDWEVSKFQCTVRAVAGFNKMELDIPLFL